MIDWDHLRIVLSIHERGSLQGAAEALGLDRATVVRRLDVLEARLGARLFERRSDGCTPTSAGAEVIETAGPIAAEIAGLRNRVSGSDRRLEGIVRVAVPDFLATALLIPNLPAFLCNHPSLGVELITGYGMSNLVQGEADIALRNRRPEQNTLVARRLGDGGLAFFASHDYLAQRGTPEADFRGHDMILLPEAAMRLAMFEQAARLASAGNVVLRVGDMPAALAAVRSGLGMALLPCILAHGVGDIVPVAPGVVVRTESYLVTHRDLRRHARIRAVGDFLARTLASHAAAIAGEDLAIAAPDVRRR